MKLFDKINIFKNTNKCHTIIQICDDDSFRVNVEINRDEEEKKIHKTLDKSIDDIFVDVPLAEDILTRKLALQGFTSYRTQENKINSVRYFNGMDQYAVRYAEMLQNLHLSMHQVLTMFDIPKVRFPRTHAEFFEMLNGMTEANTNQKKPVKLSTIAANANTKIIFLMIVYGKTYKNLDNLKLLRNRYVATYDEDFIFQTLKLHRLKKGGKGDCCICFENTTTKTSCSHYICKSCFQRWLSVKTSCPLCTVSFIDEKYKLEDTFDGYISLAETLDKMNYGLRA